MKNVIEINDGEFLETFKDYITESESIIKEISSAIIADGSDQNLGTFYLELLENINLLKDMTYRRPVQIHIKTLEKLLDRIEELARNILYTNSIRLSKEDYIKSIIDDLRIICANTIQFRNFCYITASKSKNTLVVSSPKKR